MKQNTKDMANAIRALTIDAVQKANSGHPGMPMGMAEIGLALWRRHLKHSPSNPEWLNRDRFVLSNGHGSMLIYALLHLTGYDLSLNDIKAFRTLHSKTPGHPERGYTPGVETTTGPLGQGIANAVGMAIAEKVLAAEFNQGGFEVVDHNTYVFLGDGCLMEGVSHEACSLAGTLGLGKLIVLYDDNSISIDGRVDGWFTDDTPGRFRSYGWQVIASVDGHDVDAVDRAIMEAKADTTRPTMICCKTVIGQGSPNKADSHSSHGSPLGVEEISVTRQAMAWPHAEFVIPEDIASAWDMRAEGSNLEAEWAELFDAYRSAFPDLATALQRRMAGELPDNFNALAERFLADVIADGKSVATRKTSQQAISYFSPLLPEMIGGSADLTTSNLTNWNGMVPVTAEAGGNYIYYGVREFGMSAIMNGLQCHGGLRPFGATYVTFSDYSRNAIRMAALMKLGVIHVLTHDSIALGQDGPTHQPIEHLASLRLIPNLDLWRPCDAVETAVAWSVSLENRTTPTVLALSRQELPIQEREADTVALIQRGAYILCKEKGDLDAIILATGSEVKIAVEAAGLLAEKHIHIRVVSMPSTQRFDQQTASYRNSVLPLGAKVVSVEAGATGCWHKYVGPNGCCIGIDSFGESAAPDELFNHFGLTPAKVASAVERVCQ